MKLNNKNIWSPVMIVLIVAFDQVTKYFAKLTLCNREAKVFIKNFIEFRYAENTGAAFSMLSGARWLFVVLTTTVVIGCIIYMYKSKTAQKSLWLYWSLGVIISGAIGNLIDRILYGYVIDFINPLFVNFAVFNIADCAVTLGTISLFGYLAFDAFKEEKKNESAD